MMRVLTLLPVTGVGGGGGHCLVLLVSLGLR